MAKHEIRNSTDDRIGIESVNGWCVINPGETRTVDLKKGSDRAKLKGAGFIFTAESKAPDADNKGKAAN